MKEQGKWWRYSEGSETIKYSILTAVHEGGESDKPTGSGALWPERDTGALWEKSGFLVSALSTVLWQTLNNKAQGQEAKTESMRKFEMILPTVEARIWAFNHQWSQGLLINIPGFHLNHLKICAFKKDPIREELLHCGIEAKTQFPVIKLSRPALTHHVRRQTFSVRR